MTTRRSARIQARQQKYGGEPAPFRSSSNAESLKVYCLCRQPEDGRFMIRCDLCEEWFHGDCVGITPAVGRQMEEHADEFICPNCVPDAISVSPYNNVSDRPLPPSAFYPSTPCVDFQWGDKDGETFCDLMRDAYETVVHWRRNSFLVPSGRVGKNFVLELARLYQAYANNSTLHSVALTACCVFQVLLLQKPHSKSKSKEHVECLERRLVLWHQGDIAALVKEGKCIQDHLHCYIQSEPRPRNIARTFDQLMSLGKVSAALKLLSEDAKGVLPLDSKVPSGLDGDGATLCGQGNSCREASSRPYC